MVEHRLKQLAIVRVGVHAELSDRDPDAIRTGRAVRVNMYIRSAVTKSKIYSTVVSLPSRAVLTRPSRAKYVESLCSVIQ